MQYEMPLYVVPHVECDHQTSSAPFILWQLGARHRFQVMLVMPANVVKRKLADVLDFSGWHESAQL